MIIVSSDVTHLDQPDRMIVTKIESYHSKPLYTTHNGKFQSDDVYYIGDTVWIK